MPSTEPDPGPEIGKPPIHEWLVLFTSWSYALASFRKRGRTDGARTGVITQMNRLYLVVSVGLFAAMLAYSGNKLACTQGGRPDAGVAFGVVAFALGSYCLSRGIEVFYAFYRDAFDKLAQKPSQSTLDGHRRISLALTSYVEMILNFAMLLALLPTGAWQPASAPTSITDILFYSASTITTSGGGGFVPRGFVPQAFTVFEIACGLILLVVCFAVYAGDRTQRSPG